MAFTSQMGPNQPPLEGMPPTPDGVQAAVPPAPMGPPGQQGGPPDVGGTAQTLQIGLQLAAEIAKGLDMLAQAIPQLATLTAIMQSQLKQGLRSALQQGNAKPESGPGSPPAMMGLQAGR